jgi:hypothetical protein
MTSRRKLRWHWQARCFAGWTTFDSRQGSRCPSNGYALQIQKAFLQRWRCLLQFKHSAQVVACGLGAGFGPKVLPVVDVNVLDQALAIADRTWKKSPRNMRCIQDEEQHRCNNQAYNVIVTLKPWGGFVSSVPRRLALG